MVYCDARLGMTSGACVPRWQVQHVSMRRPPKPVLLNPFTIRIIWRAILFRGTSSANLLQSCRLSGTWQPVQFSPSDAAKKPMVSMNSLTGIPFRTCTFLKTSSTICGFCRRGLLTGSRRNCNQTHEHGSRKRDQPAFPSWHYHCSSTINGRRNSPSPLLHESV